MQNGLETYEDYEKERRIKGLFRERLELALRCDGATSDFIRQAEARRDEINEELVGLGVDPYPGLVENLPNSGGTRSAKEQLITDHLLDLCHIK